MRFITILLCFHLSTVVVAQPPVIKRQSTFGGSSIDALNGMVPTPDGGCIASGASSSTDGDVTGNHGQQDVWVVKMDLNGQLQWEHSYGGSNIESNFEVTATSDGGYLVGGMSSSSDGDVTGAHGSNDYWVFKIDALGNLMWQKALGGSGSEYARSAVQGAGGNYYVMGSSSSSDGDVTGNHGNGDYWVVKLDSASSIIWQKALGGSASELGWRVQPTADGGCITIGVANSSDGDVSAPIGSSDYWVVKLDASGNIQWEKSYGGSGADNGNSIALTNDGGYILCGWTASTDSMVTGNHGDDDIWVVKIDSMGTLQWQKSLGGSLQDWGIDARQTANGEYLISGRSTSSDGDLTSNNGGPDVCIFRLDASGNLLWHNSFGGSAQDEGKDFYETSPGEYLLGTFAFSNDGDVQGNHGNSDYWILHLTDNYNIISGKLYIDMNVNGSYDSGDVALSHQQVSESLTGIMEFSGSAGNYEITVTDTGSYTVTPDSIKYYNTIPSVHTASFSAFQQVDSLNDFAYQAAGTFNDLCITLTPLGFFRPGRSAYYIINYENAGTSYMMPTIYFMPDTIVTFDSASVMPSTVTADTITWSPGLLAPMQSASIWVKMTVDSLALQDSALTSSTVIEPVAGDADTSCNYSSATNIIRTSFDPNSKIVDRDVILTTQLSNAPFLEYVINFQNTGNDTAFMISVYDTIPQYLDMNSFELLSSSHNVSLDYQQSTGRMIFHFSNIMLPDSSTDEGRSHGFVKYRVKPYTNLTAGTTIPNRAFIFFDFNAPVATNTATTSITSPAVISESSSGTNGLFIYPNPFTNNFNIQYSGPVKSGIRMTVIDLTGKIQVERIIDADETGIDGSMLTDGIYIITIDDGKLIYRSKVIKCNANEH